MASHLACHFLIWKLFNQRFSVSAEQIFKSKSPVKIVNQVSLDNINHPKESKMKSLISAAFFFMAFVIVASISPFVCATQDDKKADDPSAKQPAAKGETQVDDVPSSEAPKTFIDLMNDWKTLELKFKAKEAEYTKASFARKSEIEAEYLGLVAEAEIIVPALRKAAVDSYEKEPNKDESVVRFLVGALTDDLSKDKFDDFFALGEVLIKGKIEMKHLEAISSSKRLNSFGIDESVKELMARYKEVEKNDLPRALIKTSYGDIELELFEDAAPNHVANFINLVTKKKYYDGTTWHRVDPSEKVIQAGIPADGTTRIDYVLEAEFDKPNRRLHFKGALGAAQKPGDVNSASDEFYIVTDKQDGFNARFTVFGRVISGMEFVNQVKKGDKILSVEITRKRDHEYEPVKYEPPANTGEPKVLESGGAFGAPNDPNAKKESK